MATKMVCCQPTNPNTDNNENPIGSKEDRGNQTGVGQGHPGEGAVPPPTATCPYCLDSINVHARRCRHCGGDLEQPAVSSAGGHQVVYVLDRGIVRFVKVSLSLFGLLSIAGLYVLGIDLKRAVSDIHALKREIVADGKIIADQSKKVAEAETAILAMQSNFETKYEEIEHTVASVEALRAAVQSDANSAKQALKVILETQGKVLVVLETLSISPDGAATVRTSVAAIDPERNERRPFKLWEVGTALHVRFLGGTPAEHDAVKSAAREWTKHANIQFVFDDSPAAPIKIAFEAGDGIWSYVGTDGLDFVWGDEPTMNAGWSDRDSLLRLLGHVLGLRLEHQNPFLGLQWNEDAVYEKMSEPPNFWNRDLTFYQIIRKYSADTIPFAKPFDPNSIMMYKFDPGLLMPPFEGGITPEPGLSPEDIKYIAKLYPKSP